MKLFILFLFVISLSFPSLAQTALTLDGLPLGVSADSIRHLMTEREPHAPAAEGLSECCMAITYRNVTLYQWPNWNLEFSFYEGEVVRIAARYKERDAAMLNAAAGRMSRMLLKAFGKPDESITGESEPVNGVYYCDWRFPDETPETSVFASIEEPSFIILFSDVAPLAAAFNSKARNGE